MPTMLEDSNKDAFVSLQVPPATWQVRFYARYHYVHVTVGRLRCQITMLKVSQTLGMKYTLGRYYVEHALNNRCE